MILGCIKVYIMAYTVQYRLPWLPGHVNTPPLAVLDTDRQTTLVALNTSFIISTISYTLVMKERNKYTLF